jgi:hypothetical protein
MVPKKVDFGGIDIMDIQEAKAFFFKYDGSRFYMSRDGVDVMYGSLDVPQEVEAAWLQELTRIKLGLLSRNANWTVLQFLNHHEDYRHLAEVVHSEPKGTLWQLCAFLEHLLTNVLFAPIAVNSCARLRLTLSQQTGRANARLAAGSAIPVSRQAGG